MHETRSTEDVQQEFPPALARGAFISRPLRADWRAMNAVCPPDIVAFAHRLADASGGVIRQYFRRPVDVTYQADRSPATRADRETETVIREMIAAEYPAHGVIGEDDGLGLAVATVS